MPEFLKLTPPLTALSLLLKNIPDVEIPLSESSVEDCLTVQALGRVTASPVFAPHPLPTFPRSTVDGYAVIAADTFGASESMPAYLHLAGEVPMGGVPSIHLERGKCALIHTGGMLPEGANAVVMLEYTQDMGSQSISRSLSSLPLGEVEILRSVAVGENVIVVGEDVAAGEEVIPAGRRIRPAEIGGLMALGITHLPVRRRPRVGVISCGDEVVPPDTEIQPGQVRDVNAYTLKALVEEAGGEAVLYGIIPDQFDPLLSVTAQALSQCDLVIITAGSSASTRDITAQVIGQLGAPGVLVHGVNIRPGKPTILAVCDGKPVIGLPGNPVSASVIASLFVVPAIHALLGIPQPIIKPSITAKLGLNIPSQAGREDWTPVRLIQEGGSYIAEPVFGKSNLIFTLVRADGLVRIPPDATGLEAGEIIQVWLM